MKNIFSKIIFSVLVLVIFFFSTNSASAGVSSTCYSGTNLCVTKRVINLTSGNINWQPSVNANPYDTLSFVITLQTGNQAVNNVTIKEYLPSNLVYAGNLLINSNLNYTNNPINGINIGTIPANGIATISYQVKVYPLSTSYGTISLSAESVITSNETPTQNLSTQVILNNQQIYYGATYLSTGITNNLIIDSFFIPLFLLIIFSWLYFSGRIYKFSDWISKKIKK